MVKCITNKQTYFGHICPKDYVPEALWFVQINYCSLTELWLLETHMEKKKTKKKHHNIARKYVNFLL